MKFQIKLKKLDACKDAVEWAKNYKTFQEVWDNCERADWMLWIAGTMADKNGNRKQVVLAACKCARRSLKYVDQGEKRPLEAIQTAERWATGKASLEDVRSASASASASAASAASASSASASASASAASARKKEHKAMCKIIRKMLNNPL